jgi:acetolactate synthase-1/2/3 large subunit
VLLDILKNVTAQSAEFEYIPKEEHFTSGKLAALLRRSAHDLKAPKPNKEDIRILLDMIEKSEKPMLICGGGVVRGRADKEFTEFAEKMDAPAAITVMGAGGFHGRNKLATGMVGMHGSQASNIACNECDLLIAVGCRFSDRVALDPDSFASQAKIVQIDIDRSEVDKNVLTTHHIIGDAKQVLAMLNKELKQQDHTPWKEHVFSYKTETEYDEGNGTLTPKEVFTTIARMTPEETMVTTDVGQHQMWTLQHFKYSYPGQLITSGGFGTMGFGLGAAIGAKVGNPDKVVVHITGDGSFRMNCNELSTVEHYDIPVITVIFDNRTLGMVRQWQTLIYNKHYSQTTLDRGPDFVKLAEAYGLKGKRVTTVQEMEQALQEALDWGHGYVIDCAIDMDEMVRPMVGGGSHITKFIIC